jgi:sulfite reductase alpha subunit-like flavoprotein
MVSTDSQLVDSFMSSTTPSGARPAIATKFCEEVPVCTNPRDIEQVLEEKRVVFLLAPQDGEEATLRIISDLERSIEGMNNVSYAICVFQNKKMKYQSHLATTLDNSLESQGANRVVRTIEIDTSAEDQGEASFERWTLALCTTLGLPMPEMTASTIFKLRPSRDISVVDAPLRPRTFEVARLKGGVNLCPEDSDLVLTHYSVKLPEGLGYRTGFRMLILPRNPPELADAVTDALGLDADQPFRLRTSNSDPSVFIPDQVTPRQLFEQYVDLCGPPTRSLIKVFAASVDSDVRDELHELIDRRNEQPFTKYAETHTAGDFILHYAPHGAPRLESFLSGCPLTRVRPYSIASTPKKKRGYLQIIVERHTFGENNERAGLCSGYLERIGTGRITVKIEDGPGEYPKDRGTPIVIIVVGAGIATAFSLLEFRKYNDGPFGPAVLICQFPRREHAERIREMIQPYVAAKLLDAVIWVFSDDEDAHYNSWQQALSENVATIWPIWLDDRSRAYLAGRIGDSSQDLQQILARMAMNEGGLRDEEASAWTGKHTIIIENYQDNRTRSA